MSVTALHVDVKNSTFLNHFELNWEMHGHEPKVFMVPHTISKNPFSKPISSPPHYKLSQLLYTLILQYNDPRQISLTKHLDHLRICW